MSQLIIDDQTSCLKQFSWEELDENFFVAVIFRSGRRYVAQRHFEQQLFFVQSPVIQEKWRRTFFELMSKAFVFLSLTPNESNLLNEINSWHLNMSAGDARLDNLLDFEDLFDCSTSFPSSSTPVAFLFQPMTTLAAASRTLELWKEQSSPLLHRPSTGWIQIDGKILPFIQENASRFLSIDLLLKEHLISSSDDFALRPSYVRLDAKQLDIFNGLVREIGSASSFRFLLTVHSSFIRLDEFLFRSKRLFFLRFLSSSSNGFLLDFQQVMAMSGGLLTLNNEQQRLPFLYIHKQKFFPHFQSNSFGPNLLVATSFQLEFLRLISTYEYLCTGDNAEFFSQISSTNAVTLLPVGNLSSTTISLNDFHYHEYQRRSQRKTKASDESQALANGWWHTPVSSRAKRSSVNQLKIRPPIYF